jgi:two-component system response regulator MprA
MRSARVLAKMLREDGYDVELAHDGAAAIARLARAPAPDVLLTDYRMAHADGIAVAEYARSRRAGMPILMLTGYPEIAMRLVEDLRPRPVIIPKPLSYSDVTREIERAREIARVAPERVAE